MSKPRVEDKSRVTMMFVWLIVLMMIKWQDGTPTS